MGVVMMNVFVIMFPFFVMTVPMSMMMGVILFQEPSAHQVYNESNDGHENRLGKAYLHRGGEADKAFPSDQKSNQGQYDGAGESRKVSEFSGAKTETRVFWRDVLPDNTPLP
jgi:hypothetical protein